MGRGIAMMPLPLAQESVDNGNLVMLFEDVEPYEGKCFLVYPSRRFISLASLRFIDYIMTALAACNHNGACDREAKTKGALKPLS
ncbi:LysR substrate-binding domain-containing protein [Shewanella algidipiscicola]|uniref:LysR substrate-binding domain-containing protein n=1 Tax=Shewanella algidipiscicola TaxID=614070 RepID=A0ABQ4PEF0_9GAMM|nr:LysR substrate-binding domain-containing protein [Shewanella algidipiscicola]GIU45927.1 hypothetical protein TUM4630_15200 [Shewanella algidipiscicola]